MKIKLLLVALLVALLPDLGCASNRPPAGLYTQSQTAKYDCTPLLNGATALAKSAVAANAQDGALHLSVAGTKLVRDFTLSVPPACDAYVAGNGTLQSVVAGFDELATQLAAESSSALSQDLFAFKLLVDAIPAAAR